LRTTIASSTLVNKANAASSALAAIAMKAFGGSTAVTSTGFKTLKLAIAGTGIGLLVVGLAAVITNFSKIKEVLFNLVPGLAQVGEFIGSIVEAVTDFIGVTSESERALDLLKKNADRSLALNKKYLAEHGDQLDEFTKQKIAAKDAYNEAIKEDGADVLALQKRLNRELQAIDVARQAEKDEARAKEIAKEKAAADKIAAERKAAADKEAAERKKLADDKVKLEESLNSQLDALIGLSEEEKFNRQIKANEEEIERLKQHGIDVAEVAALNEALKNEKVEQERIKADEKLKEEQAAALEQATKDIEAEEEAKAKKDEDDKKADEAALQNKKDNQQRVVELGENLISNVSKLAGKNKAIQKAAIIAENAVGIGKMIISNNAANIGALATPQAIATSGASAAPVIAANNISTGLAVATTIAATVKALSTVGGGGSASAGGGQSATQSASGTPNVGFQNSTENQIATTVTNGINSQEPVKAFVVSQEVTTAQSLDRNKIEANSI